MNARSLRPYSTFVAGLCCTVVAFLMLPLLVVVLYAFSDAVYLQIPPSGLTLRWFENFFASESFKHAFMVSLAVAAAVTPISVIVGIPTGFALVRYDFPGRNALAALLMSPIIVPGVTTGIALLTLFAWLNVEFGMVRLIIGMTVISLPFVVRAVMASVHGMNKDLEHAARSLGAQGGKIFWHVVLPQLKPAILASSVFVFVECIDNFSVAVFLVSEKSHTLPIETFIYLRDFDDPTIAAVATLLIALSTALVFAVEKKVGLDQFFRF